ncbi:hypothetical protein O4H26_09505 [Aequorivita viscosa]|nr:hypothetical protein [Aequorivita viscosa]
MPKKSKKLYLLLLFISMQLAVYGQFDSILHQPLHKTSKTLRQLYGIAGRTDSTSVKELQAFYEFTKNNNDIGLQFEAEILRIFDMWRKKVISADKVALLGQKIADQAAQQNEWIMEIRAYRYIAYMYWKDQEYEKMFTIYHKLDELLENVRPPKKEKNNWLDYSISATDVYTNIGESYYFFKDNENALHYLEKTNHLAEVSAYIFPKIRAWNALGLVYRDVEKLEESSFYFLKVVDATNKDVNPIWKAIAGGNLGHNYYKEGKYNEAIPLLERDIEVSEASGIYGEALSATLDLGNIQLEMGNLEAAGEQFEKAQAFHKLSSNDDKLHYTHLLFKALSKWNAMMGNTKFTALYIDSTKTARDMHYANFNSLKLMRAQQTINQQQNLLLEEKKQKEIQERNLVILIVLLLLVAVVVLYLFRRKYFLKKQMIKELALQNSDQALRHAQTTLKDLTKRIRKNNYLIEKLKEGNDTEINQELLKQLKTSNILTNEDWAVYKALFIEVYPDFINSLQELYSDLTPSEIRCLCMEKLHLSNKEMGSILGVSSSSVMVTKHRIRKKLSLTDQKDVEKLVAQIG